MTGWQTINGRKHYFYEDGIMLTGDDRWWKESAIIWMNTAVLYTGWTYDAEGNAYYRDEYGKMLQGY